MYRNILWSNGHPPRPTTGELHATSVCQTGAIARGKPDLWGLYHNGSEPCVPRPRGQIQRPATERRGSETDGCTAERAAVLYSLFAERTQPLDHPCQRRLLKPHWIPVGTGLGQAASFLEGKGVKLSRGFGRNGDKRGVSWMGLISSWFRCLLSQRCLDFHFPNF